MDPYLGEIRLFAGNFAPYQWALCNGQILPISQYTALFSLLGANYGGDGRVTFALPNFNGAAPVHQGDGPGLTPRTVGETGGSATVTLITTEMPIHTHLACYQSSGTEVSPAGAVWSGATGRGAVPLYAAGTPNAVMDPRVIAPSGGGQAHNNYSPYLALTFIIALSGIFPPRP